MDKPTVELIRFDASDVIATSGGPTLTVSNFKDGTPGNLVINFDGPYGYSQMDALSSALSDNGYTPHTNRHAMPGPDWFGEDLINYFYADDQIDYKENDWWEDLADNINGTYTWYNNMWNWTHK